MEWFVTFCYLLFCYGFSNIVVFGEGPFYILERWRNFAYDLHPNFGKLFSCMMCFPANLGWIMSLVNWFLLPQFAFTPFNIILAGTNLWWLAMIMDMGITSGFCWLLYVIDEYFEKNTPDFEKEDNSELLND